MRADVVRGAFGAAGLALLMALAGPAQAAEPGVADLLSRLEAQEARIRALEARLAAAGAVAPTPAASPSPAPAPLAAVAGRVTPSAQEAPSVKLRGRVQFDALALSAGDGLDLTGTQVRRFYLGVEGRLAPDVRFQAEADLAGNRVSLQDVLVAYQAAPATELVAGYFKPAVTSDDATSDAYTLFLERSAYAGVFAPGRRVGLGFNHATGRFALRGGVFGEREDGALDGARKEGWGASLRASGDLAPGADVLHLALTGYYLEPSATDGAASLSQRPETNRAAVAIDTGTFAARHATFLGGEAGFQHGPFLVQAEGGQMRWRGPANDPRFAGWSAQASWRLTGESRPYDPKAGVFGRVTPSRSLADGGPGAVEAGLRATSVDLNDDGITGGHLTTQAVVLNWYPVQRLRLGANLVHARVERPDAPDLEQTLLTVRGALDW